MISIPLRKGIVGRSFVWIIPLLTIIQATVYGGLVPSQQAGTFPILTLFGYKIRLEEILIVALFIVWVYNLALAKLIGREDPRRREGRKKNQSRRIWTVWVFLGIAISLWQGFRSANLEYLMEARTLIIPLLYFILALYWMPTIRIEALARALNKALIPLVMIMAASVFMPVFDWIGGLLSPFHGVNGGFATAIEPLVVFFYALALSRTLLSTRISLFDLAGILIVILAMIGKIGKTGWAYLIEVPLLILIINNRSALISSWRRMARKRWLSMTLFVGGGLICGAVLLMVVQKTDFESYGRQAIARVLRTDIGGDISGGRLNLIWDDWEKYIHAPFFGRGMGNWRGERPEEKKQDNYIPVHFSPLWILVRGGLFLFFPILILTLIYIRKGLHLCGTIADPRVRGLILACYVFSLTMILYSLYGVPQSLFEPPIFFWLSVAVVLRAPAGFSYAADSTLRIKAG
jgi:hypothetical protein